jgi:hypothetical protein
VRADAETAPAPSAPVFRGLRIAQAPAPGDAAAPPAEGAASFPWTLAPVRWGGSLASELRVVGVADLPRRVQRVDSVETRASTYFWQPWFAQLSGGLGVLGSHVHSGAATGASGPMGADADSTALTGHGTLSVFPMSRFPFQARLERTDSRTSGELASADFTTTRMGVRQDYRPEAGGTSYSLSRDRSVLESASFGRDTLDVWEARMTRQSGPQNLDVSADRSRNSRSADGESQLGRVSARHSYREGSVLSVESLASAHSNEFRENGLVVPAERRTRLVQLHSLASWRPEERSPWFVTGGMRLFRTEVEDAGMQSETRTLSGNLGVNYQLSRKTTLSGIASLTEVSTPARRDVIGTQGLGATHIPDIIPLGAYLYGRNVSAGLTRESGGPQGERRTTNAQFGHNLTRNFALQSRATVSLNLAQSVSATDDSPGEGSETLLHSGGVSWSASPSGRSSAYASLTAADSRRTGAGEGRFQLVNLQATGQFQFSRHALGSANFTTQATRATHPAAPGDGFDVTSTGNLAFQHARAFGVPGLRYFAIYSANESQLASRQLGDLNAPPEQASQSLEQRLEYSIGRLETRLLARAAEIQGQRNWLVFLRVSRRFGAY